MTLLFLALMGCSHTPLDAFDTTLPLVVVDTDGTEMGRKKRSIEDDSWVSATTRVSIGGSTDYDGPSAIHVRGNSSREYDKVGFRLELRDRSGNDVDAELLGMPKEADWVLSGPYSDKTLMRNHLIYTLSRDIGRYAPRTAFVELFVVDDKRDPSTKHYRGVYVLTERVEKDSDRVAFEDGGWLLKRDWVDEDEAVVKTPVYSDRLLVEHPRNATKAQRAEIETWLGDMEAALESPGFADPEAGYAAWIDVDSFIDHMLLVELGRNVDGYVLSTWMHRDPDGLLNMGPIWDYNGALGNADYFQAWKTQGWHYDFDGFPEDNPNGFRWYERLLEDPAFRARRAERWAVHRAGPLSDQAVMLRIDEAEAGVAEAVDRNFEKWDVLGTYVWPNDEGSEDRSSWKQEIAYMRGWMLDRMAWMDTAVDAP